MPLLTENVTNKVVLSGFAGADAEIGLIIDGRFVNNFNQAKDGSKPYSIEIFVNTIHLKEPERVN